MARKPFTFYEFFAGGGMVRAGLGAGWRCLFANDIDKKKSETYRANWGDKELHVGDVNEIRLDQLPGRAELAWASFPCQDLSLAGKGKGLAGARSGTFWGFWSLIEGLGKEGRAPRIVAIENVCGLIGSGGGKDLGAIIEALQAQGYRAGGLVIDAIRFVPQSRPRLLIVGVGVGEKIPQSLVSSGPSEGWHPAGLIRTRGSRSEWLWFNPPAPPERKGTLAEVIEHDPPDAPWHSKQATGRLIAMMSPTHRAKLEQAQSNGCAIGGLYRRTRSDGNDGRVQRAEVRFDAAGCLRAPAGGSSRQTLVAIENGEVRTRLFSKREGARLMGLADTYCLPENYNAAWHVLGDGVAAPVVRFLAKEVIEQVLRG